MQDKIKMKNILLLIPNLGKGGAQKVFLDQFEFLSKHAHVTGCVFNWSGAFESDKRSNIMSLEVPAGNHVFSKAYFFCLRIVRLRKLKAKLKTDVSISHLEGADYVNVLSGIGEKKILWIHGTKKFDEAIHGWIGYLRKAWLMPWLYKRANRVVTVSKAIATELQESYPALKNNLETIYNGIDYPRIQQLKKADVPETHQALCENHFVIITHCRLALQKNIVGLIHVIAACKNKGLDAKWVVIGDGNLRESLTQQCDQLGVDYYAAWKNEEWSGNKQLFFLGHQSNPFPFLAKAKLYVMPSDWEGFPLALCEALACGLPIVATDCYTGPREILAPGEQVLPMATQPEHAPYGVLMPLIDDQSMDVWATELFTLVTDNKTLTEYSYTAEKRAQELSLAKAMKQVHETIDSVIAR